MTNVSGETKKSMTGLINITGILSYPVEQTFCRSLKHCSTSSYQTVCSWNPLFLSGKDPIRFFSSSLLCSLVVARCFPVWLKHLFNVIVPALKVLWLGFKIRWTIFHILNFLMLEFSCKMLFLRLSFFSLACF